MQIAYIPHEICGGWCSLSHRLLNVNKANREQNNNNLFGRCARQIKWITTEFKPIKAICLNSHISVTVSSSPLSQPYSYYVAVDSVWMAQSSSAKLAVQDVICTEPNVWAQYKQYLSEIKYAWTFRCWGLWYNATRVVLLERMCQNRKTLNVYLTLCACCVGYKLLVKS